MLTQREREVEGAPPPQTGDISALAAEYEGRSAEDVIRWGLERFGSRIAISTSFQADSLVILEIAHRIDPAVRVFTIDTGRLPPETYALIDRVRERYGITVEVYFPDHEKLAEMVGKHGVNPFYRSVSLRLLCCNVRKVEPMNRALSGLDAWFSGLRRTQGDARAKTGKIEADKAHAGVVKVNPLADWTDEQVWEYINRHDVPYNDLYDKGYTSIGCAPCTRPTEADEDARAGRWWWEEGMPKECGIHLGPAWVRTQ